MSLAVSDINDIVRTVLFRNAALSSRVSELETEVSVLRAQLSLYSIPAKDSHNSSVPPAMENLQAKGIRHTRSLRPVSSRPTGGQSGHEGSTLRMSETADETITHTPDYCSRCGESLSEISGKVSETRQSIDIPLPVCAVITNHVSMEKKCSCGQCNKSSFPGYVKTGVSYGVNLHALTAYLSTVQHIPFKRLVGTLKDLYGIEISQGSVSNILNRMRRQSQPGYEAIRGMIERSQVCGADETGENLNGKLHWMWTFQNELVTYIFQHQSRGKAAIDSRFPQGLPKSILVTDRHSSYFNMETSGHQLCLAHLLRELIYLGELDKSQQWSHEMLDLLRKSIHIRKTIPFAEIDIGSIKKRFDDLIKQDLGLLNKKFHALQRSLNKHTDHLFEFLEHPGVPYDNNASERSIRPLKVKQKVSGMFKSDDGADAFCVLHSIVDTAKKNKQNTFSALIAVAENVIN